MRAEIIASGTELLLGEVQDANTSFIASQLASLGIDLYYASIVGDNYERFLGVLRQAFERSDIVIITGGLGPTKGDITRNVIAGLMGETMMLDSALKQQITEFFARIGLEMPDNNLKQAMLIPCAAAIPNPLGTAPGWWAEKYGKIVVSLPGPPGEMQPMWRKEIAPRLEKMAGAIILSRTLKTWGLSEAKIDELVGPYMALPNPTLALYARADGIQLRITAKAATHEEARELTGTREAQLREILGANVWGADSDTLEDVVGRLIVEKGLSLAVAESFTGGLLACAFSGAKQHERFFRGGLIAADSQTRSLMGIVLPGESDGPTTTAAARMAAIAKEKFQADIGMGIDGITKAEGKEEDANLAQAFVAVDVKDGRTFAQAYQWRVNLIARRAVIQALFSLRKVLLDNRQI